MERIRMDGATRVLFCSIDFTHRNNQWRKRERQRDRKNKKEGGKRRQREWKKEMGLLPMGLKSVSSALDLN